MGDVFIKLLCPVTYVMAPLFANPSTLVIPGLAGMAGTTTSRVSEHSLGSPWGRITEGGAGWAFAARNQANYKIYLDFRLELKFPA